MRQHHHHFSFHHRIRDYPDFEYRALDWLLNAETNRWCYDFGDGAGKCVERVKRHLDRAFYDKINMIHFDGFGWGLKRLPGYAATIRELNAYARDRGISLVFSGYGGGYGAIYQRQFKKQGKFLGKALRNRRGYPSGEIYKCMGIANPSYPVHTREFSRTVGSCVSNESLRTEKIKDIVRFVKQVEPGALYIHDLDTGDYKSQAAAWQMRCDQCREQWPNDTLEAQDGSAGAYAAWFTQLRQAISQVNNTSGYRGEDCLTLFTGPLYTEVNDDDDIWRKELTYFKNLSGLMPSGRNVFFCIREQVLQSGAEYRAAQLSKVVAPKGHGIFSICFVDANLYDNDHVFSAFPTSSHIFKGSRIINHSNGHVHQEPLKVFDAMLFWNCDISRDVMLPQVDSKNVIHVLGETFRRNKGDFHRVYGQDGILARICEHLYGKTAARHMASFYSLSGDNGFGPTTVIWYAITRHLWNGAQLFDGKWLPEWRERLAVNEKATPLIVEALQHLDKAHPLRDDVLWLKQCLTVATDLLRILCECNFSRIKSPRQSKKAFLDDLTVLRKSIRKSSAFEFLDPLGGDVGAWLPAVDLLEERFLNGSSAPG